MAINETGDIGWFSPDPRAIIPLDERFHVSHSLRRMMRQGRFAVTINLDFPAVIRACASSHGSTWISPGILGAYEKLHREGFAHSMEARLDGALVGGLYGVALGGAFFGESMFHEVRDASKVALTALVDRLRSRGFTLLDTQWQTPHLATFGTLEIPRSAYLDLLMSALARPCRFDDRSEAPPTPS
jgi:leucyl/phenylalanyl-tRNA--protein transferase